MAGPGRAARVGCLQSISAGRTTRPVYRRAHDSLVTEARHSTGTYLEYRWNVVRKTKAEALETRERLLEAAGRVFCEKGVNSASLDDVAKAAGVTRGAIYWHFKNKSDLVDALLKRTRIPQEEAWDECCGAAQRDPLGYIREKAVDVLRRGTGDEHTRQVWNILFHKCEPVDDAEPITAHKLASRACCAANMETFVQAAIDRDQLPAELDPRTATTGLFSYLDGLIYNWLMDPESVPLDELAEQYVDIYIEGLKRARAKTAEPRRKRAGR